MSKKQTVATKKAKKPTAATKKSQPIQETQVEAPLSPLDNKAVRLQPMLYAPWEALGILPFDLIGWVFSAIQSSDPSFPVEPVEQVGLVIHSPVTIHVSNNQLRIEPPPSFGPFQIIKDWSQVIRLDGNRLIYSLPLHPLAGRALLMVSPPDIDGTGQVCSVLSTCFNDQNPQMELVVQLDKPVTTIPVGQPIGHLIPFAAEMPVGIEQPVLQPYPMAEAAVQSQTQPTAFQVAAQQPITPKTAPTILPAGIPQASQYAPPPFSMRVWRIHPHGVRIEKAEKTLRGDAPQGAVRWCGPFTHANSYGFWVFPPAIDLDIIWYGGRSYDYKILSPFSSEDVPLIRALERPDDVYKYTEHGERAKLDFGSVMDNVVTMWTGCVFQTPPGWSLMIRNPINVAGSTIFRVQEGILETDWLSYDIWLNLQFLQQDKWVQIRRDAKWPPIAQLIPVYRDGYEQEWTMEERSFERDTPEGQDMYDRWMMYNYHKWYERNGKEPATYHIQRASVMKDPQFRSKRKSP